MEKKCYLFISIFVLFIISLFVLINKNNNEILANNVDNAKFKNNVPGMFAIMLETEAGTGQYEKSTLSIWPGEGYVFNENLSACENGGELSWNEDLRAVTLSTDVTDKCNLYFDIYRQQTLAEYIINNVYVGDGENDLYYHDGRGTYVNASEEAKDYSYRYVGANPNNYVCFESDEETCPEDNLYRIIGLFKDSEKYQIKLIKSTSIGNYSYGTTNNWASSDIKNYLNTTFLNSLKYYENKISPNDYKVSGMKFNGEYTVKQYFSEEIENSLELDNTKIGLMYVSDYGYAASPTYWAVPLYNYNQSSNSNWLLLGAYEWTMSRRIDGSNIIFYIRSIGFVDGDGNGNNSFAIRPCFYLDAKVEYVSGNGEVNNPYIIK